MPTINSIVRQANMAAEFSVKFFGTNFQAANNSMLFRSSAETMGALFRSEFGGQPALNNLIENYREQRQNFNQGLRENLDSLRDSAEKLRESTKNDTDSDTTTTTTNATNNNNTGSTLSTLGEFARGNVPPQDRNIATAATNNNERRTAPENPTNTRAENVPPSNDLTTFANEYLTADETEEADDVLEIDAVARDDNADNRLNNVRNLVRDYNATVNYLNQNRGLSSRVSALANNFGNRALTESLNSIGISVNRNGELSVNEEVLSRALNNDAEGVNQILGSEGLTGRLERDVNLANAQQDRLFPNVADYAGNRREDYAENLYTTRTINTAAYAWENTARLLAMLT